LLLMTLGQETRRLILQCFWAHTCFEKGS